MISGCDSESEHEAVHEARDACDEHHIVQRGFVPAGFVYSFDVLRHYFVGRFGELSDEVQDGHEFRVGLVEIDAVRFGRFAVNVHTKRARVE